MFQKFSDLQKAKELQKAMASETLRVEDKGVTVVVNGGMKIEKIRLNPQLELEEQSVILRNLINQSFLSIQKKLATKILKEKIF
jgi:DNA-binding protein YbaB